jgi:formylglycine-generating enzyme required for sulfatase activity
VRSSVSTNGGEDHPSCVGGVPGVYDMSGNTSEWEDACEATNGATDVCHLRGGNAASTIAQLACAADERAERQQIGPFTGIRCCADLQ